MAAIFAVIGIATMFMSVYGVREKEINVKREPLSFIRNITATFSNKAFVICVIAVLLTELGRSVCTATIAFYSKYVLEFDMGVTVIMGVMFASSMVFAPVVGMVCRKMGAKNSFMLSSLTFAVCTMGFFFAPSIIFAVIIALLAGFGVSGTLIISNLMYAEIIDDDQTRTDVRREGSFFGMNALVMRLSIVMQGLITTFVWAKSGYVEGSETQIASAVTGIRVLMGVVPFVFALLAAGVLVFYPLTKSRLAEIQEKVRLMNEE